MPRTIVRQFMLFGQTVIVASLVSGLVSLMVRVHHLHSVYSSSLEVMLGLMAFVLIVKWMVDWPIPSASQLDEGRYVRPNAVYFYAGFGGLMLIIGCGLMAFVPSRFQLAGSGLLILLVLIVPVVQWRAIVRETRDIKYHITGD